MPKATTALGDLNEIDECYIQIAGGQRVVPRILPEISDSKSTSYTDESIIGRSFPVKTFSHSENRTISIEWHFIVLKESDIDDNLRDLRLFQSCCYPRDGFGGSPYRPPPVCKIKCGKMLGNNGVCAVLKSYTVKYPTDQVIDIDTMMPHKFSLSMTWDVVYASSDLPGQTRIVTDGS